MPDLHEQDWPGREAGLICLSRISQAWKGCLICLSRIDQAWNQCLICLTRIDLADQADLPRRIIISRAAEWFQEVQEVTRVM